MKYMGKGMNNSIKKGVVVAVILLFIGTCIIPSATSELTNGKNIITVDDEPGDADFTSIKEAVNYSSPGDTIEVYSGIYREEGIRIEKDNIALLGIAHELGEGNDTGKPFIKPDGNATVIVVEANHVIVSNFRIEMLSSSYCIKLGAAEPDLHQNNITISECILRNPYGSGIYFIGIGRDINIIDNQISNCRTKGIYAGSLDFTIKGNVIINCGFVGIEIFCNGWKNISYNTIKSCGIGIKLYLSSNNIIYGNDIGSCNTGILNYNGNNNIIHSNNIELCPIGFSNEHGKGNRIIKNNFKECWNFLPWFKISFIEYLTKDRWIDNYWDTWGGVGPKIIPGILIFSIPVGEFGIPIPIPWFAFDWNPAQEPYDIGVG
jgi:parallel beta-helix repeat protein